VLVRQILHPDLGCASYLIADGGEAAVVDPKWEIDEYLSAAREAGAEIRHILETHTHADPVSGRRRLADRTGARIHLPADPSQSGSDGLRDGDVISVGQAELRAVAAPGHRPEHLAFTVHPSPGAPAAHLLSGDSLLLGGVARPDLAVDGAEGATALFRTLQRLVEFEDDVELWPAHVGGSLCGAASLNGETSSTIALERERNQLLRVSEPEFVAELTGQLPVRPPRVRSVVERNRAGAPDPEPLTELDAVALRAEVEGRVRVMDLRSPEEFDAGHLTGSVNLAPASSGIGNRAGWATREDEAIVLIAEGARDAAAAAELLRSAGIWNLAGFAVADPGAWDRTGLPVSRSECWSPAQVQHGLQVGRLRLVDVRDDIEWEDGHVPGSVHLPLPVLRDGSELGIPGDLRVAVACAAGARAALAASIIRRAGYEPVVRMTDGIASLLDA
jgi:glyoxylase-like metal-dependent hydrolase (beta-lactamase superfamily II)